MNRDTLTASASKLSTPKDIIDLYTKIPDYAQVKHLGNSEFINTLERLKEEFRQIRASLYEDSLSDLENDTDEKLVHVNVKPETLRKKRDGRYGLTSAVSVPAYQRPACSERKFGLDALGQNNQQYLSITSCPLHTAPVYYGYRQHHNDDALRRNYLLANITPSARPVNFRNRYYDSKTDSAFQDDDELETGNERRKVGIAVGRYTPSPAASSKSSSSTTTMSTTISVWSSNPEIYHKSYTDYVPPANIEKRIQWRNAKSLSRSEPQLYKAKDSNKDMGTGIGVQKSQIIHFKSHPVPDHVHQPLFDQIMLRNKLRSEQVREESKQRLLAQVKPFSFTNTATSPATLRRNTNTAAAGSERKSFGHGFGSKMNKDFFSSNRNHELYLITQKENLEELGLNNTKPSKHQQKQSLRQCLRAHHHDKKYEPPSFKAKPAPPRTRALMAAVRLREQQEYRELKKRLRAEALMKTSSLPPSMAARDKRQKATQAKINAILNILDNNSRYVAKSRRAITRSRRISASSTDEAAASLNTDDETGAVSDDEHGLTTSSWSSKPGADDRETNKSQNSESKRLTKVRPKNFTSFGPSKCAPKEDGVFESTAVDNHASRLRVQAARKREQDRIRREQEEHIRLQKMENRRQRLRVWHMPAWKHASSYSSTQDISMRCELRLAASILEKEAFRRDMNNMLTRVQSAPLLLEGVRERKYELCKKHRKELGRGNDNITPRSIRIYSPRNLPEKVHWTTTSHVGFIDDQYGHDKSETAAIAEGTYSTNSDNESVKNIELDSRSSAAAAVDNNEEEDDFQKRWREDEIYLREGKIHQWEKDNGIKSLPHYNETVELLNETRLSSDYLQKESEGISVSPELESPKLETVSPERDSSANSNNNFVAESDNGAAKFILRPEVDERRETEKSATATNATNATVESVSAEVSAESEAEASKAGPEVSAISTSTSLDNSSWSQVIASRFAQEESTPVGYDYVDQREEESEQVQEIDDAAFFD